MRDLRGERELRGVTLRHVARATGIPIDILASLEAEPEAQLRPGSTIARWRAQYAAYLRQQPLVQQAAVVGGSGEPTETTAALTAGLLRTPMSMGRALAMGVAVAVLVVLGLWVAASVVDRAGPEQAVQTPAEPETYAHELAIRALEPSRLRIEVDGELVQDGVLPVRGKLDFKGQREIAVEVPDLTRVRISYNGQALRPLGNLSAGRRLVFIQEDDR